MWALDLKTSQYILLLDLIDWQTPTNTLNLGKLSDHLGLSNIKLARASLFKNEKK